MKQKFLLKDYLFNPQKIKYLSSLIKKAYPKFDDKKFTTEVLVDFHKLELKERISHIRIKLKEFLPQDFKKALKIILKSLPEELDENKTDNDFGDFIFAPLAEFVAFYGCEKKYLDLSLNALEEITKRFSAEDSIRYFINSFQKESLKKLEL